MRQDLTEIVFILDKSGSMSPYINDTIGGFNGFIEKQKLELGDANVSLYLFDNNYTKIFEGKNIKDVTPLTNGDYIIGGSTALLDAMGRTIDDVGIKLAKTPEYNRPGKVIFVVITDGQENSSIRYTDENIKDKIKHQETKYSWQFLFLSADITQFDIAQKKWGVVNSFSYTLTNTKGMYDNISDTVACYRSTGTINTTGLKDLDKIKN